VTGEDRKAYSPERLDEATAQLTELAEKAGVKIALCGGLAMQSYGSERLTKDVDLVAPNVAWASSLPVVRQLTFGGVQMTAPNGVPVNLIVRVDEFRGLYDSALQNGVSREGVACLVIAPEHLAAMKLAARRPRDTLDLHWLISSKSIDVEATRNLVHRYLGGQFAAQEFEREVELALFEAEREKRLRK
jgi:hypothetical protein